MFVPTRLQVGLAPLVIANTPVTTPAATSPASVTSNLFTVLPLRSRYSPLDYGAETTPSPDPPQSTTRPRALGSRLALLSRRSLRLHDLRRCLGRHGVSFGRRARFRFRRIGRHLP